MTDLKAYTRNADEFFNCKKCSRRYFSITVLKHHLNIEHGLVCNLLLEKKQDVKVAQNKEQCKFQNYVSENSRKEVFPPEKSHMEPYIEKIVFQIEYNVEYPKKVDQEPIFIDLVEPTQHAIKEETEVHINTAHEHAVQEDVHINTAHENKRQGHSKDSVPKEEFAGKN